MSPVNPVAYVYDQPVLQVLQEKAQWVLETLLLAYKPFFYVRCAAQWVGGHPGSSAAE